MKEVENNNNNNNNNNIANGVHGEFAPVLDSNIVIDKLTEEVPRIEIVEEPETVSWSISLRSDAVV